MTTTRLRQTVPFLLIQLLLLLALGGSSFAAFESGSSCGVAFFNSTTCKGAFNPPVNTTVQLPPSGILDYTTFTVPAGVEVRFAKNAANTPVIIRTSGDVNIIGNIVLSGTVATNSGTAADGKLGDDGQPGLGGPGGFDGGFAGNSPLFGGVQGASGGSGKGPGGGASGYMFDGTDCWGNPVHNPGNGGGGGGFGANGGNGGSVCLNGVGWVPLAGGNLYGQANLLPLIGGSGGGGGNSGVNFNGGGGGGGGGAIMIASSGTINVGDPSNYWSAGNGIAADGGAGGTSSGDGAGNGGGGGSGGAIKLVADTLVRSSYYAGLWARGGGAGNNAGGGGAGRIYLEANTMQWSGGTDPGYNFGTPGKLFVPNSPTLKIISVAGTAVPVNPTGVNDVTLPAGTTTASVALTATNIPVGSTATIHIIPAYGNSKSSALSSAFAGNSNGVTTATADIPLSPGNNVILATVTFTIAQQMAALLPKYQGESVAKIRVEGRMGGESKVTYITASGKEFTLEQVLKKVS